MTGTDEYSKPVHGTPDHLFEASRLICCIEGRIDSLRYVVDPNFLVQLIANSTDIYLLLRPETSPSSVPRTDVSLCDRTMHMGKIKANDAQNQKFHVMMSSQSGTERAITSIGLRCLLCFSGTSPTEAKAKMYSNQSATAHLLNVPSFGILTDAR